jgi:hypothetical protein
MQAKNGVVELATVSGGKLWVMIDGWKLKDEQGMTAKMTIPDVNQSNGDQTHPSYPPYPPFLCAARKSNAAGRFGTTTPVWLPPGTSI